MRKIIFLILSLSTTFIFSEIIVFEKKVNDGKWGRYIGVRDKGPLFINNEYFCYINDDKILVKSDLYGNESQLLDIENPSIYKIFNGVYITNGNKSYIYANDKLERQFKIIHLGSNIYYDTNKGLFIYDKFKEYDDLFTDGIDTLFNLIGFPQMSSNGLYVYFLVKKENKFGDLYKYNIKDNHLVKLMDKVGDFSLLPDDQILIYSFNSQFSHMSMNLFPGDFIIYDSVSSSEITNLDIESYNNGYEYTINRFDSNSLGDIITFGSYAEVQNNKILKSYKPIILIKYKK